MPSSRSPSSKGGFPALGLSDTLLAAVTALGYEEPTPVQRATIPIMLAGRDLLAQAATGTGVTVLGPAMEPRFPADCRDRFAAAYQAQMDDFAAACRGEDTPNATLTDDRFAVAIAVAARASASAREALAVGPDWPWTPLAAPAA